MYYRFIAVLFNTNSYIVSSPWLFKFLALLFLDFFCHRGWFCINTWRFSHIGLLCFGYALRDYHRGLNSLPVSIDRKRWNGMLCLSAFWAAQRETIIISSALMVLPARSTADVPLYDWSRDRHTEEQTHAGRQTGSNAEDSQKVYVFSLTHLQADRQTRTNKQETAHSRHADRRVDS